MPNLRVLGRLGLELSGMGRGKKEGILGGQGLELSGIYVVGGIH